MSGPTRYREPARSYLSTVIVLVVLLMGFALDLIFGAGTAFAVGWAIAIVIVAVIDALTVHAVRRRPSIELTPDELRVGDDVVRRDAIVAADPDPDPDLRVLGRRAGEGLPRRTRALGLHLADGSRVVVATRDPQRLMSALETTETTPLVRPATADDLEMIADIDQRAELLFRVYGAELPQIPLEADRLNEAIALFVAGSPPVGFIMIDEVDRVAHVQAFAVLPSHMRRGLGTELLEAAGSWAYEHDYRALTLCTYADIPWNGPFYAERGFAEIALADLTPGLVELRDWERDIGLDEVGRRIAMRRELSADLPA